MALSVGTLCGRPRRWRIAEPVSEASVKPFIATLAPVPPMRNHPQPHSGNGR